MATQALIVIHRCLSIELSEILVCVIKTLFDFIFILSNSSLHVWQFLCLKFNLGILKFLLGIILELKGIYLNLYLSIKIYCRDRILAFQYFNVFSSNICSFTKSLKSLNWFYEHTCIPYIGTPFHFYTFLHFAMNYTLSGRLH